MGFPRFEVAFGPIDDVNLVFTVSTSYRPGSTAVFLNGQLKRADFDDGWTETDPGAGVLTMAEAPQQGDVVQVFFTDTGTGVLPGEEVTPLKGHLEALHEMQGRLATVSELAGKVEVSEPLNGRLFPIGTIFAQVVEVEQLQGTVEIC